MLGITCCPGEGLFRGWLILKVPEGSLKSKNIKIRFDNEQVLLFNQVERIILD